MLYKRVISGLLFLPVFYFVTWVLPTVYFLALCWQPWSWDNMNFTAWRRHGDRIPSRCPGSRSAR